MVVRGGVTPRDVLRRLLGHMPNVVGVVLNDLEASALPDYYHDYRTPLVVEDGLAAETAGAAARVAGEE